MYSLQTSENLTNINEVRIGRLQTAIKCHATWLKVNLTKSRPKLSENIKTKPNLKHTKTIEKKKNHLHNSPALPILLQALASVSLQPTSGLLISSVIGPGTTN